MPFSKEREAFPVAVLTSPHLMVPSFSAIIATKSGPIV